MGFVRTPPRVAHNDQNGCGIQVRGRIGPAAGVVPTSPVSMDLLGERLQELGFELDGFAEFELYVSETSQNLGVDPATSSTYASPHLDPAIGWLYVGTFIVHPSHPQAPMWAIQATHGHRFIKLEIPRGASKVKKVHPR